MSWWTGLLGDSKTVDTILSGATNGLDMAIFTDEEKSRAMLDVLEARRRYMLATNPQNVARRLIAFMVVGLWVFLILLGVLVQPLSSAYSDFIFKVLAEVVDTPESIVLGFYFLTHMVRSAKGAA